MTVQQPPLHTALFFHLRLAPWGTGKDLGHGTTQQRLQGGGRGEGGGGGYSVVRALLSDDVVIYLFPQLGSILDGDPMTFFICSV